MRQIRVGKTMNPGVTKSSPPAPAHPAKETIAVVLAGGKGTRLGTLTRNECKPALPFGGTCRIIDFSLSNCINSGIQRVGIATQYCDATLVDHINRVWGPMMHRNQGFIEPWRADLLANSAGYCGTANAVFQNWKRIAALGSEHVLILAGDHVYKMDYRPMLEQHISHGADVTVGCVEVPLAQASQFGVMSIDDSNRIVRFTEKPRNPEPLPGKPDRALGSMGIYVFNRDLLRQLLVNDAQMESSSHDFGRDLIPRLIGKAKILAYPFTHNAPVGGGYWRDVGTISAYWRTHMELAAGIQGFRLDDTAWPVWPGNHDHHDTPRQVSRLDWPGRVINSLLAGTSQFEQATVCHSVLFENAKIGPGATLLNAIILPDAVVGRDCRLSGVIVGAGVNVPSGTVIEAVCGRNDVCEPTLVTADTNFEDFAPGHDATLRQMRQATNRQGQYSDAKQVNMRQAHQRV